MHTAGPGWRTRWKRWVGRRIGALLERGGFDRGTVASRVFGGIEPEHADAVVAKNYLDRDELEALNRIVNAYLEFAELQALDLDVELLQQDDE